MVMPAAGLPRDRLGHLGECVPGHGAGVAEAEVDVLEPVDVDQPRTRRGGGEDREGAGPARHPRHRDTGQQRPSGLRGELGGAGVEVDEALVLGGPEIGEALAVDHEGNLGPPRMAPPRTRQWSREPPASPCASAPEVHRRRAPHAGGAQLLTSRGSVHAVAAGVLGRAPPRLGDPRRGGRRPVVQLGRGVRSHGTGGRRDRFRHRRGHCCAGGRPTVVRHRRARGLASRGGAHPRTARRGGRRQRPTALGRRRVVPGAPVR